MYLKISSKGCNNSKIDINHRAIVSYKTKYYTDNRGNICAKSIKVLSVCV